MRNYLLPNSKSYSIGKLIHQVNKKTFLVIPQMYTDNVEIVVFLGLFANTYIFLTKVIYKYTNATIKLNI